MEDCSRIIPWPVDNKYYSAQVQFVVCSHSGPELVEREWEALLLLFNLAKVLQHHLYASSRYGYLSSAR